MIEWNRVIYADCMNEENGLPTLEDKSIDLCFTDPIFNINLKNNINEGKTFMERSNSQEHFFYFDNKENYEDWCKKWQQQLTRICNIVIIYCGNINKKMWYKLTNPLDEFIYFMPFNRIITPISWIGRYRPLLLYAEKKTMAQRKLHTNVIVKKINIKNNFIHPCPLDYDLSYQIIKQLKPTSFIDPFMGSGTNAQVCKELGIPWIGYELNEVYSQDINKRLINCRKEPQQITLKL